MNNNSIPITSDPLSAKSYFGRQSVRLGLILLLNATIGAMFACYLFTPSFLRGQVSVFVWPDGDMQAVLTGAKYFIYDAWRFPLFVSGLVERTTPQSMLFTDFIPLFALIAKIIYSLTGYEIKYLGYWYPTVIVAQPIAFSLLLWFGGVRSMILQVAGAILSILVPAFLYRVGHAPLMAHFTFITAMAFYFASTTQRSKGSIWKPWLLIAWPALLISVMMINVYLLAMALVFFGVALAQCALMDLQESNTGLLIRRSLYGGGTVLAILVLMYVIGFFIPYQGGGRLGFHGTNLLSPIVPQLTLLFNNSLDILDATGGQYEGYNYFGAGILLLLMFALVFGHRKEALHLLKRHWILMLGFAALTLFALSNVAYAGKMLLWSLPAPEFLGNFRSSGRFIWPVTYFMLFLGLYALKDFRRVWLLPYALAICISLQWRDMQFLMDGLWNMGHNADKPKLREDAAGLRALIAQHEGVHVEPDYGCLKSKRGNEFIADIAWYASLEHKPINTLYFSRSPIDMECNIEQGQMLSKVSRGYLGFSLYPPRTLPANVEWSSCADLLNVTVCMASQRTVISDDDVRRFFSAH